MVDHLWWACCDDDPTIFVCVLEEMIANQDIKQDILKILKENGIVAQWKRTIKWGWAIAELNRALHERDYYKLMYDEMRKVLGG